MMEKHNTIIYPIEYNGKIISIPRNFRISPCTAPASLRKLSSATGPLMKGNEWTANQLVTVNLGEGAPEIHSTAGSIAKGVKPFSTA
jgi:hypothetical protein